MSKPLEVQSPVNRVATYNGYGIIAVFEGTPTASAVGYQPGCLAIDVVNGKHYKNTGTAATATWTEQTT